ncbi:DEAD/DEAH box helicase [Histidinibacterium aquaticum]|uniref:DEAD/DEAH box helicase n=1 Tax=Histidinibacterium aquaticum TaxID=2613962 RepID=A0A5J5GEL1_9RHOB|nr:DEAD/DEAH box helicase [Histidinibacterium aquaticum]KAA9006676.1 DEAD/DEAH box helicase [Histidinibacterium aquaticum]
MNFDDLGLAPKLTARLTEMGLTDPTPIQAEAIPKALQGRDVLGLAQTGTGKTLAFGLPLVQALTSQGKAPAPGRATALILAPTRELARQIAEALESLTKGSHLKVALVVGGNSLNRQSERMKRGADLLIATPGRLMDLIERRAVSLSETRYLVLDEADQMLDMGFIHVLRKLVPMLPDDRHTMLFSATLPREMESLAASYLNSPARVQVSAPGLPADRIAQGVHFVEKVDKPALLAELLSGHIGDRALVFSRTKHGAERLMKWLVKGGFDAASIHGNKSQGQRDRALNAFRSGSVTVLVATDVAARGIDIPGVAHVYNLDLPEVADTYVHRIGRTARAGAEGKATAFCAPDEMGSLEDIEKRLGIDLPTEGGTRWPSSRPAPRGRGKAPRTEAKTGGQRRRRPNRNRSRKAA